MGQTCTELVLETNVTGRALLQPAADSCKATVLGFHGYAENAEIQLSRLEMLLPDRSWNLISVQGLYAFYNRTGDVVASWMTKQNREAAIRNNLAFINAVIENAKVDNNLGKGVIFAGFSQGTSMAYRAAAASRLQCLGVIAVGGDIPPELDSSSAGKIGFAVQARGNLDKSYPEEQLTKDIRRLESLRIPHLSVPYAGSHEWNSELCAALAEPLKRFLA
ncbi:MAG: hypothetical protein KDD66_00925 [Bdellovibrionales bacterium]|nr:hypothetical protein [Bdellovibrionales bacterium]